MNGPEHYVEAERLLAVAARVTPTLGVPNNMLTAATEQLAIRQAAQVHATLALAAATVHEIGPGPGDVAGKAGIEVTS